MSVAIHARANCLGKEEKDPVLFLSPAKYGSFLSGIVAMGLTFTGGDVVRCRR